MHSMCLSKSAVDPVYRQSALRRVEPVVSVLQQNCPEK